MSGIRLLLVLSVLVALTSMVMPVHALSVNVQVEKNFSGEFKDITNLSEGGLRKFSFEFFNSGSLPYRAIARLDIFEGRNIVSTSWSDYKILNPGERANFELFGYLDHSGNFTPRLRVYFANEIDEKWQPAERFEKSYEPSDIFKIANAVSGKDYVAFDLLSPESSDIIILASDYLPGWIFHQASSKLSANVSSRQKVYYEADFFANSRLKINIFSSDGKALSSQYIEVNTEEGSLSNIIESLVSFVSSFLH